MTKPETPVQSYQRQFQNVAGNGGPVAQDWLGALRQKAMTRFVETGFPSTHEEDWRFTSVQAISETPFELAGGVGETVPASRLSAVLDGSSQVRRLVFVDGIWSPSLSRLEKIPPGVRVESFSHAMGTTPAILEQHLARHARPELSGFTSLSTAFLGEGALVHVSPGVEMDEPIQVVFAASGVDRRVSHPRTLVVIERSARATVQEVFLGLGDAKYFTNAVTELVVGDGARLDHCRFQQESQSAYHVATTQSRQGRDSVLESCSVAFGAGLSRHDIGAVLDGSGAFLTMNGLSVAQGRQHVDHHTVIDHAQPHCESHELFNGIFDDQARGVFNGRIVVRPGAQRTDSKQTNNNLLLSADARADSQPQLEIYADDVKCTHGATLGPLDDASMFYLRSRGIDAAAARRLLTYGFGVDIVGRIHNSSIRRDLDRVLAERLQQLPLTKMGA